MQYYIKASIAILCFCVMTLFVACSSESDLLDQIQEDNEWHTCELSLNITMSAFSDEPQSRAGNQWTNGSKIYLTFTTGQLVSYGNATYNNGSWLLNYNGQLAEGNSTSCAAVFFDHMESEIGTVINLSPQSAIYEDNNCSYNYQNGKLSIEANLRPKTGRIRFMGTNGNSITLYGITHYISFDYALGKFNSSNEAFQSTVSSQYTPYIYGFFSDAEHPRLNLITATSAYTRFPSNSIYKPGESGYMTIPSEDSHRLWINAAIFKINGVEFKMIPVSFPQGNFLLAETETTEELYDAVLGGSSTSQLPKCGQGLFTDFLTRIKSLTGLKFRYPNYSEWQYAFIGGDRTHGYTYSGSNNLSEVGWYKENSNGTYHAVKQLQPNELGFYDMSGNAFEIVSDYTSRSFGGDYRCDAKLCQNDRASVIIDSRGLRLALSNN